MLNYLLSSEGKRVAHANLKLVTLLPLLLQHILRRSLPPVLSVSIKLLLILCGFHIMDHNPTQLPVLSYLPSALATFSSKENVNNKRRILLATTKPSLIVEAAVCPSTPVYTCLYCVVLQCSLLSTHLYIQVCNAPVSSAPVLEP